MEEPLIGAEVFWLATEAPDDVKDEYFGFVGKMLILSKKSLKVLISLGEEAIFVGEIALLYNRNTQIFDPCTPLIFFLQERRASLS